MTRAFTNTRITAAAGDLVDIVGEEVIRWPKKDTERAIVLVIEGSTFWIPRSQVKRDPQNGSIRLTKWITETKGILPNA